MNQIIVLITGGNTGIGYELCRQLLADPSKHVLLGSRSITKGDEALKNLQAERPAGTVELLQLDVTDSASIANAAKHVEDKFGRLDVLVNNAGTGTRAGTLTESMLASYHTNAIGPQLMGDAFVPLLKKSNGTPRLINISSAMGSIQLRADVSHPGYNHRNIRYCASKAALNMVTAIQAVEHGDKVKVFAFCPGFTASDLGPINKVEYGAKPTHLGAFPIIGLINGERDKEAGKFLHVDGEWPW